jgi:pimeloyl-ACP methyl ester carboxylesterase
MGFTVVAPLFQRVRDLRIDLRDAEEIGAVIRSVAKNRSLTPPGRISLFAPSFSAAISLVAASRPGTSELVKAVWTLGTPGNVGSAMEHMMGRSDADLYGTYILFKNFIELSVGKNTALKRAFHIAAQDNLHKSTNEINRHLERLNRRDRRLFEDLTADPAARLAHWRRIRTKIGPLIEGLSTGRVLDGIIAPVLLMHGAEDAVVPASESRLIYDYLKKRGRPARLAITELITHGDIRLRPRSALDLIRLIRAIGFFFRHAGS